MSNLFDERLKRLEQEIDDIKTARERLTGATTTVSKVVQVKGWGIGQEYSPPYASGYTIVKIWPKDPNNGFFLHLSQSGISGSGDWNFYYITDVNEEFTEYQVAVGLQAANDQLAPGEMKEYTKQATIVASGQFDYSIEYKEPE